MKRTIAILFLCFFLFSRGNAQTYCMPTSADGTPQGLYINSVIFNNLNNSNSGGGAAYHDYTSLGLTMDRYRNDTISVKLGQTNGGITIYIDWDNNGLFSGNELIGYLNAAANTWVNFPISIPSDAIVGITRMRMITNSSFSNGSVNPCPSQGYGEVEDYSITIADPYPNSVYCLPNQNVNIHTLYINEVSLNSLHSVNTGGQYYYGGLRNETTTIDIFRCDTISVKLGQMNGGIAIYIDWDNNGLFNGNELIGFLNAAANTWVNFPLCVPSNAAVGITRMRIITNSSFSNGSVNPCPSQGYGEVEDYNITITNPYPTNPYCEPPHIAASSRLGYINDVILYSINALNTGGQYYYSIRTESTQIAKNSSNNISVKSSATGQIGVYIDYDQDGDFESAGTLQSPNVNTLTANIPFTVPSTALLGITRMRVVYGSNGNVSSCPTSAFNGEVEDYNIEIVNTVNIEDLVAKAQYSIYPNPTNNDILLQLELGTKENITVEIYDILGHLLKNEKLGNIMSVKHNISMSEFPSGVYTVTIGIGNQFEKVKIIKI